MPCLHHTQPNRTGLFYPSSSKLHQRFNHLREPPSPPDEKEGDVHFFDEFIEQLCLDLGVSSTHIEFREVSLFERCFAAICISEILFSLKTELLRKCREVQLRQSLMVNLHASQVVEAQCISARYSSAAYQSTPQSLLFSATKNAVFCLKSTS